MPPALCTDHAADMDFSRTCGNDKPFCAACFDYVLVCCLLRNIIAIWNHQPLFAGFNVNIRLSNASKPAKLNQAKLEVAVTTPTTMAKVTNTVKLALVKLIVNFSVNTYE